MGNNKTSQPKLAIVIHTEEEFDWNGGFYRSNNQVTHGDALIAFCEQLIAIGGKITFALDYAFVNSESGKKVIRHFKSQHAISVEFATHLHPWVNPPHDSDSNNKTTDEVSNLNSYPGNLSKEGEFKKLQALTNKIKEVSGYTPTTYLAGRYGIGENTLNILQQLEYKADVSISPFSDFRHQQGPDFSESNNHVFEKGGLIHWPHTTAILALFGFVTRYFDKNPAQYERLQKNTLSRLCLKLLRVKRQRLSPEGLSLNDLKNITDTQLKLGHSNLILSFHSPSVKAGLTPYVNNETDVQQFLKTSTEYLQWFVKERHGEVVTVEQANLFDKDDT